MTCSRELLHAVAATNERASRGAHFSRAELKTESKIEFTMW